MKELVEVIAKALVSHPEAVVVTEKTVNDIFTKNDFKDAAVMKTVVAIRQYAKALGFSQQWTTNFVYRVVMLAKKEKQPKE